MEDIYHLTGYRIVVVLAPRLAVVLITEKQKKHSIKKHRLLQFYVELQSKRPLAADDELIMSASVCTT